MENEDVTQAESSPAESEVETSEQAPVSAQSGDDRPVQNVVAEFNRKLAREREERQRFEAQVLGLLQQQRPQLPQQPSGQVTDEELFERAKMGDQAAFAEWTDRRARRQYQQQFQQQTRQNTVVAQMQALQQKYPAFNNPGHPLTQSARTAYQYMVANGYPDGAETLLDAMKTAVADNPQMVTEMYSQTARASDSVRQNASRVAHAGQTGASVRQEPAAPRTGAARPLTKEQQRLARQMGLDDEKAKSSMQRFKQRRESGQSNIGAVGNMIDEESL